jgi:competence protein ComEC
MRILRRPVARVILAVAILAIVAAGATIALHLRPASGLPPAAAGKLTIFFLDVGQGDGTVIRTPGGKTILVDTGTEATTMVRFLEERKFTSVDVLIATHPHSDHLGGATYLLERVPVKTVYDSGKPHTSPLYESFLRAVIDRVRKGETTFQKARAGQVLQIEEGLTIEFIHPVDPLLESVNDASIVAKLVYRNFSILFTGDAEANAEAQILARRPDLRAKVLKVAHHGSKSSTTVDFLEAVKPEAAVIQAGVGNSYGHPHGVTLEKFNERGIKVYATSFAGPVTITSDGTRYQVQTGRR